MTLTPGLTGEARMTVTDAVTAAAVGSGGLAVFATPTMIALMEKAALEAVQPHLGAGESTVGTLVNVKHMAATPLGMTVRAVAKLEAVEGRRLTFAVEAYDDKEKVGEGTHERFIILAARFLAKVQQKGLS
jgi:fluoroacetyl-CoA thioesterase